MSPHAFSLRVNAAPRGGCAGSGRPFAALIAVLLMALAWIPGTALAQSVALAGMLGNKALLIVDGSPPKSVVAGQSYLGVKVLSTSGDEAVLEISGKRQTLRVGDAPVSVGSGGNSGSEADRGGRRIVLTAGSGGHFTTAGQINGRAVQFVVDTGATVISMSAADAERAGIAYKNGQPVPLSTANGMAQGFRVKLDSVRVGDVEVFNVDAVVSPLTMPYMLLGNSFLTRFQISQDNNQMTLTKRY